MKDYLSLTQAAEKLGLTRQATHYLYSKGKFPGAVTVGNQITIPEQDVIKYIESKSA